MNLLGLEENDSPTYEVEWEKRRESKPWNNPTKRNTRTMGMETRRQNTNNTRQENRDINAKKTLKKMKTMNATWRDILELDVRGYEVVISAGILVYYRP
jgi:hypothetical protein